MGARHGLSKPTAGWLALAITVALVLLAALATAGLGHREDRGEPADTNTAAADHEDGRFRLGPDQVPSVFGLTADHAADRLEALGLRASVRTIATCRDLPGRALWTRPATGRLVSPGTEVVVTTAAPGARCRAGDPGPDREAAWRFLDFIDGRAAAPAFAAEVTVFAGGAQTALPAIQAGDPSSWPGLDPISRAVTAVDRMSTGTTVTYRTPTLGTRHGAQASCGTRPPELRGRPGLVASVGIPTDGVGLIGRCTELTLFRNHAGAIDAVLVSDARPPVEVPGPADVVGDSATFARARLETAGFTVVEVARPDCGQVGTVSAQAPAWGDEVEPGGTVTIGVVDRSTRCQRSRFVPPTPLTRAAEALVAFARDEGPAPATASEVDVYVGDELHATLTADAAVDRASWSPVLDRLTAAVAQSEGSGAVDDSCLVRGDLPDHLSGESAWRLSVPESRSCADDWSLLVWVDDSCLVRGDLPDHLSGESAWRLSVPESRSCADDWSLLVWVDDAGAIRAVDLLTGRT